MWSQFKTFQICLLFMALTSLNLLGCGDLKKINEVKEATEAVKKGTDTINTKLDKVESSVDKVGRNTDQLAETSKGILKSSTAVESSIRNVETGVTNANQNLSELLDVTQRDSEKREKILNTQARRDALLALERAVSLKERYSIAKTYFLAFDFQAFKTKMIEARPAEYDLRLSEAVKEFFLAANRFGAGDYSISPTAQPSSVDLSEDHNSVFNALVLSLHERSVEGGIANDERSAEGKRPLSLFDVFVRALNQRTDIQRGSIKVEETAEHVQTVLLNEERAFQILQARHNGFAVRLAGELFNYEEMGLLKRFFTWFRSTLSVNLDDSNFSLLRLKRIESEVLLPALENKKWMIRIGKRPEFTYLIRELVMKLEISTSGKAQGEIQILKKRIIDLYKDYISETNASGG